MPRGVLPFGSEFSPSQVDLSYLLELAFEFGGDWHGFEASVRTMYFEDHNITIRCKKKLANNTKLAMIAYGLIDMEWRLSNAFRICKLLVKLLN